MDDSIQPRRRRTWRRRLAQEWLDGWDMYDLAHKYDMTQYEVEEAIRRVVRVKR